MTGPSAGSRNASGPLAGAEGDWGLSCICRQGPRAKAQVTAEAAGQTLRPPPHGARALKTEHHEDAERRMGWAAHTHSLQLLSTGNTFKLRREHPLDSESHSPPLTRSFPTRTPGCCPACHRRRDEELPLSPTGLGRRRPTAHPPAHPHDARAHPTGPAGSADRAERGRRSAQGHRPAGN